MFTIEYFYICFLLLVLHFSVPSSADEPTQNVTTQTAVTDSTQAPDALSVPNLNAASESSKATIDCTQAITTNETLARTNLNITKTNNTVPECGTKSDKISTTNSTTAASELPQKETNETTIAKPLNGNLSSTANLDVSNLNTTDNSTSASNLPNKVPPPDVFPNKTTSNGTRVIPYNTSALNTTEVKDDLLNSSEKNDTSSPGTEVQDLLDKHNTQFSKKSDIPSTKPNLTKEEQQNTNNIEIDVIDNGQNTEDDLRNPNSKKSPPAPGVPLVQGQLAAILAAVFVVISVITYIGLLTWRRFLENRYGNRELLVNEDEFNDRDMRHFTI